MEHELKFGAPPAAHPLVSVCIANFNGVGLIEACINSVLAQNCQFPVEIIVYDDASTDDSVRVIQGQYPQVCLMTGEQNVGFCTSNNRMVAVANGEYVLLLNNDAELFPDALSTLKKAAEDHGQPSIIGLPQFDAGNGELLDIGYLLDPFLNPIANRKSLNTEVGFISGACLWIPRTLWNELGGFPEWFGSLAEDMYLCLLARLRGYSILTHTTSGFRHWVGKSLGGGKVLAGRLSTKISRRFLSERNKCFVMCLTYPTPFFQLLLPTHLVLLLLEGVVLAAIKRDSALFRTVYLSCVISLWKNRRQLTVMRKEIQRNRTCSCASFFAAFNWTPQKIRLLLRHGIPEISH